MSRLMLLCVIFVLFEEISNTKGAVLGFDNTKSAVLSFDNIKKKF